ncbi:hypothetical protein Mapa_014016 [Marchantia paleacea]|nr:hypothetical protein Mapa_014016 [Marchantia paleacea]
MARIRQIKAYAQSSAVMVLLSLSFFPQKSRGGDIECETSAHSPNEKDVSTCIKYIKNLAYENCCNNNCFGTSCTTMQECGEAAVAMCGVCTLGACWHCIDAAEFLELVRAKCRADLGGTIRVGGYYQTSGIILNFVIFNSADGITAQSLTQ